MSIDLGDYVDSLRREVTPLGSTAFANVTDDQLTGYMTDGLWEARLDGFLAGFSADEDGIVTPVNVGGPDITRAAITLVILYAGIRILRNKILNMNTSLKAKAGPVEFEQQSSATMLTEMLKQLQATKAHLIDISPGSYSMTPVSMVDGLSVRQASYLSYFGGYQLTDGLW